MHEFKAWFAQGSWSQTLMDAVEKLCQRVELYALSYDHPHCHRTSNLVDRLMNCLTRYRRQLSRSGESLVGLYPGNPLKATQRPTTERLLKAFDNITLTILNIKGEEYGHVTPLNQVQKKILRLLGLDPEIYSNLAESPG